MAEDIKFLDPHRGAAVQSRKIVHRPSKTPTGLPGDEPKPPKSKRQREKLAQVVDELLVPEHKAARRLIRKHQQTHPEHQNQQHMASKSNMTLYERIMAYRKLKQEKGDDEQSESPTPTGTNNDRNNSNYNSSNNNNNNNNNNEKNYRNKANDKRPRKLERSDTGFASVDISQYTNRKDEEDLNRSPSPQPTFSENASTRQRSKVGREEEEEEEEEEEKEEEKKTTILGTQNVFVSAAHSSLSSSYSPPPSPSSSSKPSSFSTHPSSSSETSCSSSRMCPSSSSTSSHRLLSVSSSFSIPSPSYEPLSSTHPSNPDSHRQRTPKMVELQNVNVSDSANNSRLFRANTCSFVHTRKREMSRQNWGQQGTVSKKGQRLRKIKAHLKGLFVSGKAETERCQRSSERERMEIQLLSLRGSALDQYQLVSSSNENDLETVMDLEGEDEAVSTINEHSNRNGQEPPSPLDESRPKSIQFNKSDTLLVYESMQEDCQDAYLSRDRTTIAMADAASKDTRDPPSQGSDRPPRDTTSARPGSRILKVKSLEPGYQDSIPSIVDISNQHKKYVCLLRSRSEGHLVGSESGEHSRISNIGSQSLSSLDEHQEDSPRDGPPSVPQRSEERPNETSLTCAASSTSRRVRRQSHPMHNLGWGEVNQNSLRNQSSGSGHALELDLAQKYEYEEKLTARDVQVEMDDHISKKEPLPPLRSATPTNKRSPSPVVKQQVQYSERSLSRHSVLPPIQQESKFKYTEYTDEAVVVASTATTARSVREDERRNDERTYEEKREEVRRETRDENVRGVARDERREEYTKEEKREEYDNEQRKETYSERNDIRDDRNVSKNVENNSSSYEEEKKIVDDRRSEEVREERRSEKSEERNEDRREETRDERRHEERTSREEKTREDRRESSKEESREDKRESRRENFDKEEVAQATTAATAATAAAAAAAAPPRQRPDSPPRQSPPRKERQKSPARSKPPESPRKPTRQPKRDDSTEQEIARLDEIIDRDLNEVLGKGDKGSGSGKNEGDDQLKKKILDPNFQAKIDNFLRDI